MSGWEDQTCCGSETTETSAWILGRNFPHFYVETWVVKQRQHADCANCLFPENHLRERRWCFDQPCVTGSLRAPPTARGGVLVSGRSLHRLRLPLLRGLCLQVCLTLVGRFHSSALRVVILGNKIFSFAANMTEWESAFCLFRLCHCGRDETEK